ncbi:hypothetical protein TNCV_2377641 [Trichonephila clavipes]|nr:hypothetical protein TNCV_2377641 [Trichonephila clavipes]
MDSEGRVCEHNKNVTFLHEDGNCRQGKAIRQHPKQGRFPKTRSSYVSASEMRMVSKDRVKGSAGHSLKTTAITQHEGYEQNAQRNRVYLKREEVTNQSPATRGLLETDHVILNHGQVTWTTPELAPRSPNYRTTPT